MNRPETASQQLLRIALFGNAGFSLLSAAILVAGRVGVMRWIGAPADFDALFLAVGLIVFALWLLRNAFRSQIKLLDARLAVGMDLAWVALSLPVVAFVPLTTGGKWVVDMVATIVLCFAITQWVGIRRINRKR